MKNPVAVSALCLALLAAAVHLPAAASADQSELAPRSSQSLHHRRGGRASTQPSLESEDRYPALQMEGRRDGHANRGAEAARLRSNDFWIYYADVQLFNDDDHDGYYHGVDLLFDADTVFEVADVYAVLYLSYEGGPWNEYAVTGDFSIYGATSDDEYVVVTELEAGYPTGSYDLLIELYDAWDGTFLAEYGPADSSGLSYLPLEDYRRDDPGHRHTVTVVEHGGGAAGAWVIPLLATLLLARRRAFRRCA